MNKWLLPVILFVCHGAYAADDEYSRANQVGKPNFQVMGCPAGSFWDPINGGECWKCPAGGVRSVEAVDGPRACVVTPQASFSRATRLEAGKASCPSGSFQHRLSGECWTCPAGYKRTIFDIDGGKACEKPIARKNRKATYSYTVKSLLQSCRKGTFANVGSRKCYTCPDGWKHDPTKTVGTNGVCFKPATVDHEPATLVDRIGLTCDQGFFDPIDGGSCWSCPAGYERQVTSVKSNSACIAIAAPRMTRAEKVASLRPDPQKIVKGVSELGCGTYGRSAFFDPINLGSCWTCPSDHPRRSLYGVDSNRACMTGTCGKEGGRPCLVWERIPSCNAGLVEDFVANECRRPTNLACKVYVNTLAEMIRVVDEANAKGQELADEALDRIPGARLLLAELARKGKEMEAMADDVTKNLSVDEIMEPFETLVGDNQVLVKRVIDVAKIARDSRQEIINVLTDPELVCTGNVERIAWRLNNLGIGDVLNPPRRYSIGVGQVSPPPGALMNYLPGSGVPPRNVLLAANNTGILKHHRIAIDLVVDIPVGEAGLVGSLGLQFSSNFMRDGSHGLYFMHSFGYARPDAPSDWIDSGRLAKVLGNTAVNVGLQYNGPTPDACDSNPVWNWGIPFRLTGWLAVGLRMNTAMPPVQSSPACLFGGFTVTLPNLKHGRSQADDDLIAQAQEVLVVPTPSAAPGGIAGAPAGARGNRFKLNLPKLNKQGVTFEGGLTIDSSDKKAPGIF